MAETPNVLFILTDQWPATHFGHRGSQMQTPNVDRLAADGTVFTNAHSVCPLCSPARGVLLTGLWPWRTGMYDNYGTGYSTQSPLDPDVRTWIEAAVANGFQVGYFGKWHLGPEGPRLRGAHEFSPGIDKHNRPFDNRTKRHSYAMALERQNEAWARLKAGRPPFYGDLKGGREQTHCFRTAGEANAFLERHAGRRPSGSRPRPFMLTVSLSGPHFPHYLPQEYAGLYNPDKMPLPASLEDGFAGKPWFHGKAWWPSMNTAGLGPAEWRKAIAYTWGHMSMVDDAIGHILAKLEELGLVQDTLILFSADHGDMCGEHNRFDKGPYFYEEVLRIPLIIRAPAGKQAEQPAFVSLADLGATLFSAVGEAEHAATTQGRDLLALTGSSQAPQGWPQEAYATYHLYNGMSFECRCIKTPRYKYVWNMQVQDELYDLREDTAELRNLADDAGHRNIKDDLENRLRKWLERSGDQTPHRLDSLPEAGTIIFTGKPGP